MIRTKRVYEPPKREDGYRVLVDRLWPHGLSRDAAQVDLWLREVAPSDALRRWFGHDPAKWTAFREKYRAELRSVAEEPLAELRRLAAEQPVLTLLYAAKDDRHNNAVVLREMLGA